MTHDPNKAPAIEHLDPGKGTAVTESGELERPRLARRIDCAGNPEIADRGQATRGGAAPPSTRG